VTLHPLQKAARAAQRLAGAWSARRRRRAEAVLDELKLRYHAFRALLADNDRALDLLNDLDVKTRTAARGGAALSGEIEELLHVTYEMVDGLNRLDEFRHESLYERHERLAERIRALASATSPRAREAAPCVPLSALGLRDRALAGGKAAALGRMARTGLPVPEGFAITADAGRRLLMDTGLSFALRNRLRRLEGEPPSPAQVREHADAMGREIMAAALPEPLRAAIAEAYAALRGPDGADAPVSVRSSAVVEDGAEHSFAGQFESVLNVVGVEGVVAAYKKVLASNCNGRSIVYRLHHGLPLADFDMAVLVQRMVDARAAGVLFTVDPRDGAGGRMLLSAAPGVGVGVVDGDAPVDVYAPPRADPDGDVERRVAHKDVRQVCAGGGGLRAEPVPEAEADAPLLDESEVRALAGFGRLAESLFGGPQDLEWAVDRAGRPWLLQSRPLRLPPRSGARPQPLHGRTLFSGGTPSSPGRCIGRVRLVRDAADLERPAQGPEVAVMHQSLVRAARFLPVFAGVVVELGNPADHLSSVAREYARPMLCGAAGIMGILSEGRWVLLDVEAGVVQEVDEALGLEAESVWRAEQARPLAEGAASGAASGNPALSPELDELRSLLVRLNLTDAYGPTFSIMECRSLHDVVRYAHEKAVLAMFEGGDLMLDEAESLVHRLDAGIPFHFFIIDLGGGLGPDVASMKISIEDVRSQPFLALWQGITAPGLAWNRPPPAANLSGLFARNLVDAGGARPLGSFNYALVTRDYLNLNARVDYHFAMVDAVCGPVARENYVRFRFKGGGAELRQRERRARFLALVLREHGFFTDRRGDLLTASLADADREAATGRLNMLGRLLCFSRLLDAGMLDEKAPERVAEAFLRGDYALANLSGTDDAADAEPEAGQGGGAIAP
jgi:pyruvate,water dikinase